MSLWRTTANCVDYEDCRGAGNVPSKLHRLHAIIAALVPHIGGTWRDRSRRLTDGVVDCGTTDSEGDTPPMSRTTLCVVTATLLSLVSLGLMLGRYRLFGD